MMKKIHFFILYVCGFSVYLQADSSGLERELNILITLLNTGSRQEQIYAFENKIKYSGIMDERLFDLAEYKLLQRYKNTAEDEDRQYVAWLIRLLSFSGNPKYLHTLQYMFDNLANPNLRRHANLAMRERPMYARWAKVISANLEHVSYDNLQSARLIILFQARDPILVKISARSAIKQGFFDEAYLQAASKELLYFSKRLNITNTEHYNDYLDAAAWLARSIGSSGNRSYRHVLGKVYDTTHSGKLKRWAKKGLKHLGDV